MVDRLGQEPQTLKPARYAQQGARFAGMKWYDPATAGSVKKELCGVDVFLHWDAPAGLLHSPADELAALLASPHDGTFRLATISNRGTKVWPGGFPDTFTCDQWICRFTLDAPLADLKAGNAHVIELLTRLNELGLDCVQYEGLYSFDGERGYSLGQGE